MRRIAVDEDAVVAVSTNLSSRCDELSKQRRLLCQCLSSGNENLSSIIKIVRIANAGRQDEGGRYPTLSSTRVASGTLAVAAPTLGSRRILFASGSYIN